MARSWGETLARLVDRRIGAPIATTALLQGLATTDPHRINGALTLKTDDGTMWQFNSTSTAVAGPGVIVPTSGTGRWLAAGGGAVGIGTVNLSTVRARTTAALPANTRVGNVITADGNGALAAQDGVTLIVGERLLLANEVASQDNGPYQVTQVGTGALPFILTRVGDADASAEVTAGMLQYVSEGTTFGNEWAYLTTDDPITLNTTGLAYAMIPNLADLASAASGLGASLIGFEDAAGEFAATDMEAVPTELLSISTSADLSLTTRVSTEESTSLSADASLDTRLDALTPGHVSVSLFSFRETNATADVGNLAAVGGVLASDSTPALQANGVESQQLQWIATNQDQIATSLSLPGDIDGTADVTIELWVSSAGVPTDAASFTVETSWDGAAIVTDTVTDGAASNSVHRVTGTIAAADVPDSPSFLSMSVIPAAHATDAINLFAVRLEYTSTSA